MGLVTLTFDLEIMQVASKVGNLPSEFEHARPSASRVIRYVCDGRNDRRTDGQKQRLLPLPYGRDIKTLDVLSQLRLFVQ